MLEIGTSVGKPRFPLPPHPSRETQVAPHPILLVFVVLFFKKNVGKPSFPLPPHPVGFVCCFYLFLFHIYLSKLLYQYNLYE